MDNVFRLLQLLSQLLVLSLLLGVLVHEALLDLLLLLGDLALLLDLGSIVLSEVGCLPLADSLLLSMDLGLGGSDLIFKLTNLALELQIEIQKMILGLA